MSVVHSVLVEVKRIRGKGRGVFARCDISEGTEIERVPVLVLPADEIQQTRLATHCFLWGKGTVALPLGYGALYNHSYSPNAEYRDLSPQMKSYVALRAIPRGEEITINYNGSPDDRAKVAFEVLE